MEAGSPPVALDARASPVWRVELTTPDAPPPPEKPEKGPAADAAEKWVQEQQFERDAELTPATLLIEIDRAAGRFVNVLLDPRTREVIVQYPSESQLAYSRAIRAYMQALSAGL